MSGDTSKTIEIRYAFWRLLRYLVIAAGALVLSWYLVRQGHWAAIVLGCLGLPLAAISVADALWRLVSNTRGPDMTLSLQGVTVYGAPIPWSAITRVTAQRDMGMSVIELHFRPGAGDHFPFDFMGRLGRWMSKVQEQDGLVISAFALQIGHDELVALIEAYLAETRRNAGAEAAPSPLDAPARDA